MVSDGRVTHLTVRLRSNTRLFLSIPVLANILDSLIVKGSLWCLDQVITFANSTYQQLLIPEPMGYMPCGTRYIVSHKNNLNF